MCLYGRMDLRTDVVDPRLHARQLGVETLVSLEHNVIMYGITRIRFCSNWFQTWSAIHWRSLMVGPKFIRLKRAVWQSFNSIINKRLLCFNGEVWFNFEFACFILFSAVFLRLKCADSTLCQSLADLHVARRHFFRFSFKSGGNMKNSELITLTQSVIAVGIMSQDFLIMICISCKLLATAPALLWFCLLHIHRGIIAESCMQYNFLGSKSLEFKRILDGLLVSGT